MPMIDISPDEDARLERIVPEFLRGDKCLTKRVKWAIHQAVQRAAERAAEQPVKSLNAAPFGTEASAGQN